MTDMTIEEQILSALRGSYLQVMVRDGLVVKLPCGRLSLPDETDRGIA